MFLQHYSWVQTCLVSRPLSVFHLGQSVSGHVVRAKKRDLAKNKKLRQMSQFFLAQNFSAGFAPCRGIYELYYSLSKLTLKRYFTSITHFQIISLGIKIKFESKFSSQEPLIQLT